MDKTFWFSVRENDYTLPEGCSLDALTAELLTYLASPDPVLRDDIAYYTLGHWLIRQVYSAEQMQHLLLDLLPHLEHGIGKQADDSVFGRSFAALILSHVIGEDNKDPYLGAGLVQTTLDAALAYLAAEIDLRGWLPEAGWAHSTAHTADLLGQLGKSPQLSPLDLSRILDGIADKFMAWSGYYYVHGEDERMARAVLTILQRGDIPLERWQGWIDRLATVMDEPRGEFNPLLHSAAFNTRLLLRSLYFKLLYAEEPAPLSEPLQAHLVEALRRF